MYCVWSTSKTIMKFTIILLSIINSLNIIYIIILQKNYMNILYIFSLEALNYTLLF